MRASSSYSFLAFEFPGEQVVRHQRGDVGRHLDVLPRVIGFDVQVQLAAAVNQFAEEFVDAIFVFVGPLGDRAFQFVAASRRK